MCHTIPRNAPFCCTKESAPPQSLLFCDCGGRAVLGAHMRHVTHTELARARARRATDHGAGRVLGRDERRAVPRGSRRRVCAAVQLLGGADCRLPMVPRARTHTHARAQIHTQAHAQTHRQKCARVRVHLCRSVCARVLCEAGTISTRSCPPSRLVTASPTATPLPSLSSWVLTGSL